MRHLAFAFVASAACTFPEKSPGLVDGFAGDGPAIDAPAIDAPPVDAPAVDAPPVDAPPVDAPAIDAPTIDAPPPWTWEVTTTNVTITLEDVWGTSASDVYAVGMDGTILHWDGDDWTPQPAGTGLYLFGVWANGTRAWSVGDWGALTHKDGAGSWMFETAPTGNTIYYYGVWGATETDVFAVGLDGHILRHNGVSWSSSIHGTADLAAIHGSSAGDIFAVGEGGAILHWTGNSWSPENSTLISDLRGVAARPTVAYAVGAGGKILRRINGSWTQLPSPTTNGLFDVFATATDIWIVGFNGLVLHSDGSSAFEPVTVPTTNDLFHVWVAPSGEIFAVGSLGTALRYGPP